MSKQEGGPFVSEQEGQIPLCVLRARVVWCVRAVRVLRSCVRPPRHLQHLLAHFKGDPFSQRLVVVMS